jgi:hypothetical protein
MDIEIQIEHLFECLEKLVALADDLQSDELYALSHEAKATAEIIFDEL